MVCSYENLLVFIHNKEVIAVSKACAPLVDFPLSPLLQRVHLSSTFRHRTLPRAQAPENVSVRVFLAGYLVVYHTSQVFENMGALENALLEAAVPLMELGFRVQPMVGVRGRRVASLRQCEARV